MTDHKTPAFRVRFEYDPEPSDTLHTPELAPLPGTAEDYAQAPIMALINPDDDPQTGARREVPYAEYCEYYGNPDRHVVLGCIVERQCPCCGQWSEAESLWGIDLMDDDPELERVPGWSIPAEEARALPGYLGEVARGLLEEAEDPS